MHGLELILLLLAVCAALRLLAERIAVPYVAILVAGGLGLAFLPGLPRVELPPYVLFVIFVPPLLYWGSVSFPLRDFRSELGAITRLAVMLVLVSTAAVAVLIHALNPAFAWAAAVALGAIVAPPDAVAVLSSVRTLQLRRNIQSILEGEGLANDAVALITYRAAVAAAVTGVFSPTNAGVRFLFAAVGGIGIGLLIAWLMVTLQRFMKAVPTVANTASLLTPFAAFLPAEHLGASGILSVVACGLYVGRAMPRVVGSETRMQVTATWSLVTFMLESLVFIFVGLELPHVMRALERVPISLLLRDAVAVSLCLIVIRMAWVIPSAYLLRRLGRWIRRGHEPLPNWRQVLFVGWAGLRGGDSLVLALALPFTIASGARFPARDEIVFITFCVILFTLVLQGPTFAPLARRLGLNREHEDDEEEAHARLAAAEAGLEALDTQIRRESPAPEVARYLRQRHRQRARRWAAREQQYLSGNGDDAHQHITAAPSHQAGLLDEVRAAEYRRLRSIMIAAEQQSLLALRDDGDIGDDIMRRVQRDLDMESVLLDTPEPVVEPASEVDSSIEAEEKNQ